MDPQLQPVSRFEWERLIRRALLPVRLKLVALVLSTYADPNGTRVRPGLESLAADTGQSKSTVKRCVQMLRDDFRLLEQVARGGGRTGRGKATEYRLVLPDDLLERLSLIPLRSDSGLTQESSQSESTAGSTGVDNLESELTQEDSQSTEPEVTQESHENDFQGSGLADSDALIAQNDGLRALPGEPLPTTRPTTKDDQDPITPPTQPPTAREAPEFNPKIRRPRSCQKCETWLDPDGTCFVCAVAS